MLCLCSGPALLWRRIDRRLRPHVERQCKRELEIMAAAASDESSSSAVLQDVTQGVSELRVSDEHVSLPGSVAGVGPTFLQATEAVLAYFIEVCAVCVCHVCIDAMVLSCCDCL